MRFSKAQVAWGWILMAGALAMSASAGRFHTRTVWSRDPATTLKESTCNPRIASGEITKIWENLCVLHKKLRNFQIQGHGRER